MKNINKTFENFWEKPYEEREKIIKEAKQNLIESKRIFIDRINFIKRL